MDFKGYVLLCDNYFSGIALFGALALRGIYAIGMFKYWKPKKDPKVPGSAYPFSEYGKSNERYLPKGWMRRAFRKIANPCVPDAFVVVMAIVWRDSTFARIIATTAIFSQADTVMRWDRALKKRVAIAADPAIKIYQKYMGGVDRVDKTNAYAAIQMKRCGRRYQRQVFWWLVGSIGHNNVKVIFESLLPKAEFDHLRDHWENNGFKYFHWFQYSLGLALIDRGKRMSRIADEASGAGPADDEYQSHYIPKKAGRPPTPAAGNHEFKKIVSSSNRTRCRNPLCVFRVKSKMGKKTNYGCSLCKVALCSQMCFEKWNHTLNAPVSPSLKKS